MRFSKVASKCRHDGFSGHRLRRTPRARRRAGGTVRPELGQRNARCPEVSLMVVRLRPGHPKPKDGLCRRRHVPREHRRRRASSRFSIAPERPTPSTGSARCLTGPSCRAPRSPMASARRSPSCPNLPVSVATSEKPCPGGVLGRREQCIESKSRRVAAEAALRRARLLREFRRNARRSGRCSKVGACACSNPQGSNSYPRSSWDRPVLRTLRWLWRSLSAPSQR